MSALEDVDAFLAELEMPPGSGPSDTASYDEAEVEKLLAGDGEAEGSQTPRAQPAKVKSESPSAIVTKPVAEVMTDIASVKSPTYAKPAPIETSAVNVAGSNAEQTLPDRRTTMEDNFSKFTNDAGAFFKNFTKNLESSGGITLSAAVISSPVGEGILDALGMSKGDRLPDSCRRKLLRIHLLQLSSQGNIL